MTEILGTGNQSALDALRERENPKTDNARSADAADDIGREDFLKMLVAQLENQDPLDPMSNESFAVDLAQFSQLEQLVNLNSKLDSANSTSSYAPYLGKEVEIASSEITITDEGDEKLRVDIPVDAGSVKLELLDAQGLVQDEIDLGNLEAGSHSLDLSELTNVRGRFIPNVVAVGTDGSDIPIIPTIAGVVTGFIPGLDGGLLVGDRQIGLSEIRQVREVDEPVKEEVIPEEQTESLVELPAEEVKKT